MALPEAVNTVIEPTDVDRSKDTILNLLAEGAFYVFVTLKKEDTEDGEAIVIGLQTDIDDPEVLKIVLESAQEQANLFSGQ
jgi:hypothetical protein